jgi:hypothetical protein
MQIERGTFYDLKSIASAVKELLNKAGASWKAVRGLMDDGNLVQFEYKEERFYARRLSKLTNRGLRI